MRALFLGGLVLSTFILGCSGTDSTNNASGGGGPADDSNTMTFETGTFQAPPGDSFTCFYLDAKTPTQLNVSGSSGQQGPGGHHIIIYYTDVPRTPTHHTCVDSEMTNWHQIAGSAGHDAQGAEGILNLPEGFAIKVPEGKQLVIQSHYINTTGKTETVNDAVTINLVKSGDVKEYANYFSNSDETFKVLPNSSLTHKSVCTIPQDLKIILSLGHMHEYGSHFEMEIGDDDEASAKMVYQQAWTPVYTSHPPITYYPADQPLEFKKGQKLYQTCEWTNTTPSPLAFPTEMCVGFFYYFPDVGEIQCEPTPLP
jgi:hypothetical protein